jgi:chromosome partitioning protein
MRNTPTSDVPAVTFLNQKGGVGKTSCVHHLAGELVRRGKRVLALDNDPQASLTQGFFGPERAEAMPPTGVIATLYNKWGGMLSLMAHQVMPGLDLVCGSIEAARHNLPDPTSQPIDLQQALVAAVAQARATRLWDVILIDCPPNLQLCSWAALLASTHLVVPVQAEDYGAQGIPPVMAFLERARVVNPELRLLGIIVNMFDGRRTLHRLYREGLTKAHGADVMGSAVPNLSAFPEAVAHRLPVSHYAPRSKAAASVGLLCDEFLERLSRPVAAGRRKRKGVPA